MEGLTHLRLPALPHHPPHPLIQAIRDITVTVKKVALNLVAGLGRSTCEST